MSQDEHGPNDAVVIELFGLSFRASPSEAAHLQRAVRELQETATRVPELLVRLDQVDRKRNALGQKLGHIEGALSAIRADFGIPLPSNGLPRASSSTSRAHARACRGTSSRSRRRESNDA